MEFIKINSYIEQLDTLIRQECTGPAAVFANKLGVSERTLRNHLQQLRELGIDIKYDSCKRTYKYKRKGRILFEFSLDDMN